MMKGKVRLGVFCSSNPLTRRPRETDYQFLTSKGLEVYEHPQVRIRNNYLAGTIQERVDAIHSLLKDDSIDILMAFWGGANTNQILPYLDYDLFKKYPKPIVGFSDVTALLLAVYKKCGIRTYMGASGITFDKPDTFEYSFNYFKKVLIDQEKEIVIDDSPKYADDLYFLNPDPTKREIKDNSGSKIYRHGKAEGEIIAANLQTLLVLAGTEYFPDLEGKMLFLEEAESEDPSMIHRFFTHLSQVTDLNKLKGVFIGRFAVQSGFKEGNTEEMIYDDVFKNINIPIVYNLDFGHTDPLFTIPIGAKAEVDTEKGLLKFIQ